MASNAMDLDSSLDDIIKNKKQNKSQRLTQSQRSGALRKQPQKQRYNQSSSFSSRRPTSTFNRVNNNKNNERRRPATQQIRSLITTKHGIQPKSRIIEKSSILQRTSLAATPRGGFVTKKSISTASLPNRVKSVADPSKIVITKSVSRARNDGGSAANNRPTRPAGIFAVNNSRNDKPTISNNNVKNSSGNANFNIRGLSGGGGISIRGESGPCIVVIRNLDPGANAEDVKAACEQFGQIVRCEVLHDHAGRSFGEAEVEFSNRGSALECVRQLDNEVADGRVIRAVLRSRPGGVASQQAMAAPTAVTAAPQHTLSAGPASFASQTLRSVIAPTRSGYTSAVSGKMYSDQILTAGTPPQQQVPPQNQHPDFSRFQPTRRF
ncbi:hypothetical protein BDA99DRAFT_500116 [Phascolomyces articulosus]|uniref:RRM domain-containing protein n=1 Tax=Phascolomyces articulosus TaxID=60185 RepID=A0AAD5PIA4_9FUNG|nr:hypothetical protein BDA99DRAFT_500116 [Phascolomyces articulosus]